MPHLRQTSPHHLHCDHCLGPLSGPLLRQVVTGAVKDPVSVGGSEHFGVVDRAPVDPVGITVDGDRRNADRWLRRET